MICLKETKELENNNKNEDIIADSTNGSQTLNVNNNTIFRRFNSKIII